MWPDRYAEVDAFSFYREFLEFYCRWFKPESYLEIGVHAGETMRRLSPHCARLTGVDPDPQDLSPLAGIPNIRFLRQTSDGYFSENQQDRHDLIFIDGMHERSQFLRDVSNSLMALNEGGLIVAHDTLPPSLDYTVPTLCGDAYLGAIDLRSDRNLEVYTFPARFGLTLIGKIGTRFPWRPA